MHASRRGTRPNVSCCYTLPHTSIRTRALARFASARTCFITDCFTVLESILGIRFVLCAVSDIAMRCGCVNGDYLEESLEHLVATRLAQKI